LNLIYDDFTNAESRGESSEEGGGDDGEDSYGYDVEGVP